MDAVLLHSDDGLLHVGPQIGCDVSRTGNIAYSFQINSGLNIDQAGLPESSQHSARHARFAVAAGGPGGNYTGDYAQGSFH